MYHVYNILYRCINAHGKWTIYRSVQRVAAARRSGRIMLFRLAVDLGITSYLRFQSVAAIIYCMPKFLSIVYINILLLYVS